MIIPGNGSTSKISNWNPFFDQRPRSTTQVFSPLGRASPAWIPWPLNSITIISIQDYPALRISSIHMLFNSQQCVNQSLFVLVLISISEHSLANSDRLSLYSGSFSPSYLSSFPPLRSQRKRGPRILSKDNLSGYFFASSLDLHQLLNIFKFYLFPWPWFCLKWPALSFMQE